MPFKSILISEMSPDQLKALLSHFQAHLDEIKGLQAPKNTQDQKMHDHTKDKKEAEKTILSRQ